MHSRYLQLGAASVAMVLGEMEDIFKLKAGSDKQRMFPVRPHSDFVVYANFIQENTTILGHANSGSDIQPSANIIINETAKKRFLSILSRVIKAHEGISRQERVFVHRFWSALQKNLNFGHNT
ncbi:MAG: hypothetical protein ABIN80_23175 [Dyadobacter sp.]|uniref:hypothetical protein n=1 Tax=Dyadobacter sp. TaxID=1914288 RepID=UPI00326600C9